MDNMDFTVQLDIGLIVQCSTLEQCEQLVLDRYNAFQGSVWEFGQVFENGKYIGKIGSNGFFWDKSLEEAFIMNK